MKLEILNGQVMYDHFNNLKNNNSIYVPFNEAMCEGVAHIDIFSDAFITDRCKSLGVTYLEYKKITLEPLEPLLDNKFKEVILWFDEDMFCQINMLTILAYLDQNNFSGEVTINLVDPGYKVMDTFKTKTKGFKEVYIDVLINKSKPSNRVFEYLERGIDLYLEYSLEENEITDFIEDNLSEPKDSLLKTLMKRFPDYGLGDTQYLRMIKRLKAIK